MPETFPARAEIPKITGQRPGPASVTRGNVADFQTRKNHPGDPNCLAAQRGFELLNPETRPATGKGLTANSGAIGA